MWLLVGNKTRVKRLADGREGRRFCSGCSAIVTFHECDVTDKVSAFFVELFDHTRRGMVGLGCGEPLPSEESSAPRPPAAPADAAPRAPSSKLTGERKKVTDADKDAMLAELKRKMKKDG